ncbi:hemerythrin domain-containing protein [Embleya sp. NPDC020630]|uniref:hemerythrin domain-containing protein n=1 Tax=Embleya sp. NPDC020630 TaxID=3363979 RepID=UPI0037B250AA
MPWTVPSRSHRGRTADGPRPDPLLIHAVHHALRRDLADLVEWARTCIPVAGPGWNRFRHYLTLHHRAEDATLWPVLREASGRGSPLHRLTAVMAEEHHRLDELVATIDDCLTGRGPASRTFEYVTQLDTALTAHLDFEDSTLLPLISMLITPHEWAHFDVAQRQPLYLVEGAEFLSWLVKGVPADRELAIRHVFPPAVRLTHRLLRPRHVRW